LLDLSKPMIRVPSAWRSKMSFCGHRSKDE